MTSVNLKAQKPDVVLAAPTDPIELCLMRMAEADIGSILIMEHGRVVGILTERDVLRHWQKLNDPTFLNTPIVSLMSKPVFSMRLDEIGSAPSAMIERKIRHIPLVDKDGLVIGIMSMRDVLAAQLKAKTLPKLVAEPQKSPLLKLEAVAKTMHVLTPTSQLPEVCTRFLPANWTLKIWTDIRSLANVPAFSDTEAMQYAAFMIDLDGVVHEDWKAFLRKLIQFLASKAQPKVFLVWSPQGISDKDVQSLVMVAGKARWHAYNRPLPVSALAQDLGAIDDDELG